MFSLMSTNENQNKAFDTYTYACLSTDTKLTAGVTNGSVCIEMDTGDAYMFDKDNTQWRKL